MDFEWARKLNDKQWAEALVGATDRAHSVPPMPSEAIQKMFVGSSGLDTFIEPSIFLKLIRSAMAQKGSPLSNHSKILDFGVGWGRFYRWLLRDFPAKNIIGVDVDPEMIALCDRDMPFGIFEQVTADPPYNYNNNEFDLVFLYSVFSHLSEFSFTSIIKEFTRIVKPGGFLAFTTLKEAHLNVWASQDKARKDIHEQIGFNLNTWKQKALDGDFLFVPTGGGSPSRPASHYGEAIITKLYLGKALLGSDFEIMCFSEDARLPQTFVGLRKKSV